MEIPIRLTVTNEFQKVGGASGDQADNGDKANKWEGSFGEVSQPKPAQARLRIKYNDGAGKKTERTVDVRDYGTWDWTTLLIGHCHLRDATRTFCADRVQSCVVGHSGPPGPI